MEKTKPDIKFGEFQKLQEEIRDAEAAQVPILLIWSKKLHHFIIQNNYSNVYQNGPAF